MEYVYTFSFLYEIVIFNCTVTPPLGFSVNNSSLPSQFALPHLRKTEGNIINVSSLVATIGQVGAVPYVATKVSSDLIAPKAAVL